MDKQCKPITLRRPLNFAGFFGFEKYPLRKRFTKGVALTLVFSFSYAQIVWAVDVRQMILDAKVAFEEDARRSGGMTATDLTAAQTTQEAVVAQQQTLQDLQETHFSLTTKNGDVLEYVGNTLNHITRPDGTALRKIQVDAAGNITSADLKLSDGSIQVYQNGQVIGYGTPDGSTVVYNAGQIQKVVSKDGLVETLYTYNKDATGNLIETVLDNPSYTTRYDANGVLKEVYDKTTGSRTTYSNGIIQKTVKSDDSQTLYNSAVQANGDILVTPAAGSSNTFTDAQGNVFTFSEGNVSQIKLTDGSILDSVVWDSSNLLKDADLTATDGSKYVYLNKQLTRSTDASGIVTHYTYTTNGITVTSAGAAWEYDLNKTLLKYTDLYGTVTTYVTSGAYKGLKDKEALSTGQIFIYEYSGTESAITVQKREMQRTIYNVTTFDGQAYIAQTSNPVFRTLAQIPNDNTVEQAVVVTAVNSGGSKNLKLNLISGTGSTYTWAGVTTSLGMTLNKATDYKVELAWLSAGVGIYVYAASSAKPSSPTKLITDRAWDPKFKAVATNTTITFDSTSSGYYNKNTAVWEKSYPALFNNPVMKFNFRPLISVPYFFIRASNWSPTGLMRRYDFSFNSAGWNFKRTDTTSSSGATSLAASATVAQSLTANTDYVTEVRIENGKLNFYMYSNGQTRPSAPMFSSDSVSFSVFEIYTANVLGRAAEYKNLTVPSYSSALQATALTPRVDTLKNMTITKPASPVTNPTDYLSILYGADSKLKQIVKTDNTKYIFQDGLLSQVLDAEGNPANFNFSVSELSNITGSEMVQNGLTSKYDGSGKLSQVKLNDLTIHYTSVIPAQAGINSTIDYIEKTDGTQLRNLVFDASGNITDADITTPEGEVRSYFAGQLVNLRRPDNSQILYTNSKPSTMITPEKISYSFDYATPGIVQSVIDPSITLTDTLTPVKMQYDTNFNLTKVIRQNNEALNYLNNTLTWIDPPSGAPQVFNYQKDANGNVLSYTITQGNVVTTYDANGNPTSAVINSTADNPHTLNVSYQYGKIRQIKKGGVVTFNYAYSFDASGRETTEIDDLEENSHKTYQDGNLLTSIDNSNSVLSTYSYQSAILSPQGEGSSQGDSSSSPQNDARVSQVIVSRFGRTIHTYAYSYSGSDTVVTDEENVTRTYDADKKLLYLEKDSQKFKYTYTTTAPAALAPQETVLPVTTLDTSSRSTGANSWQQWQTDTSDNSLRIASWGWVTYNAELFQAGDLRLEFDSTNFGGAIPSTYQFSLDIAVDGVVKTSYLTPLGSTWRSNALTLTGISQGTHTIRITWTNDFYQAGVYDANFKFKNLKMTQIYQPPARAPEVIVSEELIEKKLSDGSVAHYTAGQIANITQPDGTVISDVVLDSNNQVSKATVTSTNGVKQVFNSGAILEEIDPDGTHYYFDRGRISKVTNLAGTELVYTYDRDTLGNISSVWVKKDNIANLKYSLGGNLLGLKVDGVLTPSEVIARAQHAYEGGNGGEYSIDGDFNTAQVGSSSCAGCGGSGTTLFSTHTLSSPQAVQGVTFKMVASGYASGRYIREWNASYRVEVLQNNVWQTVSGSSMYTSGGDGSGVADSGKVTLSNLNLTNVSAIRAVASGFGNASGGEGSSGGSAYIYELQYSLADQSFFDFNAQKDALGQVTGYSFSGYLGNASYDTQGNFTPGSFTPLNQTAQSLNSVIGSYVSMPYLGKSNQPAPSDLSKWFETARESAPDSQSVVAQEYSENGTLEAQIKGDQTVTLFENNKPSKVLDQSGVVLIQYAYDADGNPNRVYLKNARDTLPDEVLKAKQNIEDQRAASLLALAQQKNLAYSTIKSQADAQRLLLQAQLPFYQTQYDSLTSTSVHGSAARNARAGALAQLQSGIDQVISALTSVSSQEADAYADLDAQVKTVSDQIEADSQIAFTQLATQETNMKHEILRQEVSPIVYDYYRRILGRDPSSVEYDSWIAKIDYSSGADFTEIKTTDGQTLTAALTTAINASPELVDRQAYVSTIKTNITTQINSYLSMADAERTAYAAALGLSAQDTIPFSTTDAQKILTWLNSRSLHFGQSAFLALESLLEQASLSSPNSFVGDQQGRVDLATKAILIDVLTGVISPLDDGDLVISMFALNKVAGLYGLNLSGANLSWDDLKDLYDANKAIVQDVTTTTTIPGASTRFNGTSNYLQMASSTDWTIGQGDFMLDGWINLSQINRENTIFSQGTYGSSYGWFLGVNAQNHLYLSVGPGNWASGPTYIETSYNFTANSWHHVAVQRQGNTLAMYVDGRLTTGYSTTISNFSTTNNPLLVGTSFYPGSTYFSGAMDGLRISKGIARYTGNFTPAGLKYTADIYTKLLLYADSTNGIKDLSSAPHSITVNGATVNASTYAQSTQQSITQKAIIRYPSIVSDPSKLTAAQKQDIIAHPENYNPKVIAHINGNHYVVITGVTQDSITYIDPGKGKDKQNEVITLSKAEFLKGWKGNVTAEFSLINPVVTASAQKPTPTAKLLTKDETQKIRGAFFFFFIPAIIGAISSIGGAIGAVIAGIGSIIGGLGALVGNVLAGVGQILGGVLNGIGYIGNAIFQGISFAASSLWGALGNVGSFLSQNVFGSLVKAGFGNSIFQTAVKVGLNIAVNKGLESLGVNSTIANLASAFVTGGITGGFNAGLNASTFITGGIKGLALEGSQTLLQKVGLDANLSSVLSLASGQFVNGVLEGNIGGQLVKIGQSLATNLSFYGIQKLGQSLGIDSRISTLIGAPVSGAIGAGLQGGANVGTNIINAVKDGISRGITSMAIDYAGQSLNLNPLLTGLSARAIMGGLEGMLSQTTNQGAGFFNGMLQGIGNSLFNALNFGQTTSDPLADVAYLQRVLRFSDIVKSRGIEAAIEDHLTAILQRDTVETVFKQGGISQLITNQAVPITDANGNVVSIKISTGQNSSLYLDPSKQNVIGRDYGNVKERGTYGIDPQTGEFKLLDGRVYQDFSWGFNVIYVKNGLMTDVIPVSNSGDFTFRLSSRDPGVRLMIDQYHFDGVVENVKDGTRTVIKDGEVIRIEKINPTGTQTTVDDQAKVAGYQNNTQLLNKVLMLPDGANIELNLKNALLDANSTHGFSFGGEYISSKSLVPLIVSTPYGVLEESYEKGQDYLPEGKLTLIGKEESAFKVTMSGSVSASYDGDTSASLTINASGQTQYQGITLQGGGFGEFEGALDLITGHTTNDLLGNFAGTFKKGVFTESTVQGGATVGIHTYIDGNSIIQKSTVSDKDGNKSVYYTKFTPLKDGQQTPITDPVLSNKVTAMTALYDLLSGNKTSLTQAEKDSVSTFMYNSLGQAQQSQNLQISNLNTIASAFTEAVPTMINDFSRQLPNIVLGALSSGVSGPVAFNPVNLGLIFGQSLLTPVFSTG